MEGGEDDEDAICLLCRDAFSIDGEDDPNDLKVPIRGGCTHNYCRGCVINLQLARLEKSRVHIINLDCPVCKQPTFRADALQVDHILCRSLRRIRHYKAQEEHLKSQLARIKNVIQGIDNIEDTRERTVHANAVNSDGTGADADTGIADIAGSRVNSKEGVHLQHHVVPGSDEDKREECNNERIKRASAPIKKIDRGGMCTSTPFTSSFPEARKLPYALLPCTEGTTSMGQKTDVIESSGITYSRKNAARKAFECPHCSKGFITRSLLECHVDLICSEKPEVDDENNGRDKGKNVDRNRTENDYGSKSGNSSDDGTKHTRNRDDNRKRAGNNTCNNDDSDIDNKSGTSSIDLDSFFSKDKGGIDIECEIDKDSDNSSVVIVCTQKPDERQINRNHQAHSDERKKASSENKYKDEEEYELIGIASGDGSDSNYSSSSDDDAEWENSIGASSANKKRDKVRGSINGRGGNDRSKGDSDDKVSTCIMSADLTKLKSIKAIINFMDKIEPGQNFYKKQQDKRDECSYIRGKLRAYAKKKENDGDIAVAHWQRTSDWAPPNHEALAALIDLIKIIIRNKQKRKVENTQKCSRSRSTEKSNTSRNRTQSGVESDSSSNSDGDLQRDSIVAASNASASKKRGRGGINNISNGEDRRYGDSDDMVSARIMTADLKKMNSITAIIKFMDKIEPGQNYYKKQQDKRGECSNMRGKLRAYAKKKENDGDIAVAHWQRTSNWAPPNHEALVALIDLIKDMVHKRVQKKRKRVAK